MNSLEFDYLKRNNFKKCDYNDIVASDVIRNSQFVDDGFKDEKQIAFIKAQFGEDFTKKVTGMRIIVKFIGNLEYDATLEWTTDEGTHTSCIGGEDLYGLVSQAIVLADVEQ